jgi:predicted AAA+ superfamily ATPase
MTRQTLHDKLLKRLKEKRRFLQVLAGPRQVGKTTLVRQVIKASKLPAHYASADEPSMRDRTWIEQQWDAARLKARENKTGALLVLDEIQKASDWSTVVKLLWDADTHAGLGRRPSRDVASVYCSDGCFAFVTLYGFSWGRLSRASGQAT